MKNKLIAEMRLIFGTDYKRIDHALMVLNYAEAIHVLHGGNKMVITAAAILHDIGIHQAEKKYNSSAGNYQEIEGLPIARAILEKYDIDEEDIEHICRIIANHHSDKDIDTLEFRTIWDADWLVNIPEEFPDADSEKLTKLVGKVFKTTTGKEIAIKTLIEKEYEI